ncbi:amidohydrolase [Novosphingobium lindaniclasticum]|uniref:Amidohydrolase n=1 Tax=Novosphingobium lindaniclasticum LE124 TaxID=1096930 RepID=T0HN57_9SPHN|nr:amidohydrolase [Novosphingobium lindaniclasticum]EQB13618.1 amidohydrolase [Novosphingobium lindaniclasticum LE124]
MNGKTKWMAIRSTAALPLALLACGTTLAAPRPVADMVLLHGTVIPMTAPDAKASALAVKDGKILAVGSDAEVEKLKGKATQVVDLAGRTLLPGFIDAHGHITMLAQQADLAALSPPPVGGVSSIAGLQETLRAYIMVHPQGWIIGSGYDDAELAEKRHPTRQELDAVLADRPILIMHASGHLAAANTKALELAGLLHPDKDPPGGVIRREADGKTASGVIEEGALFKLYGLMPQPTLDHQLEQLTKAQHVYASYGLTTAQDGATMHAAWDLLQAAARRKALFLDVHALPLLNQPWEGFDAIPFNAPYVDHLRAAGVKIIADGSPQGRTAWLSHPYHVPPEGKGADYAGYPQLKEEVLRAMLAKADEHGWQAYIHVNGDAAIQQLIDAVRVVGQQSGRPMQRTIAIHSQTATLDELKAMKTLDIEPTFFASHTYYWGDWHREVTLGPSRADRISPQRDAFDVGLKPSIHNDSPIVPPDMIRLIWSAATRRTRSNDILGPEQRVTPYEALMEVTRNAAYEIHEEAAKGTLEPGKVADLVILDSNPLTVPPEDLLKVKVMGTIKDGHYIFGPP